MEKIRIRFKNIFFPIEVCKINLRILFSSPKNDLEFVPKSQRI
ncbi:hypothetical protein LEP1GSC034_1527 [Leptospira interrogans str. 2003000735]|uniref:Uncharacterized protein n=5 Tax=Leptospira interrogans TaxID=173 RepID=M6R7A9_LEPIR|nr:hypothetical protein G436_4312 [Leptospira interrogans serovar Hardjo str. Norma]EJO78756.1 hypothetical protein LEP1GSC045_0802 [Leptospira interrogans serovar Pomona str. Kennewicki LC82-25]EJP17740.1 hypothetical protein LEP1GSC080_4382 [Leptospira interrogans str. FPW2026]EKN87594.1 hypothetical protein LEP1GSC027_3709 [Leptospira interrogans str. 2002000624]EKN97776.1 hypothetical protein LEP1GSC014_3573 [Leptospira interrogans serovar Pomona str. Pomona]EKO06139.1 hypothetical protein